jgi:hypothetical protein
MFETKVSSYAVIQEGWMNDIFSEIVNCELTQPPYDTWFTNKWQYLSKRPWFLKLFTMADEILDYFKYNDIYYVLVKVDADDCKLWKVAKDVNGIYSVKTDLTPIAGLKYDTTYNKWAIYISAPDVSTVKISNGTPTNPTDTINVYGDFSDTLKDTTRAFDSTYIWTYWVITSHSEKNVKSTAVATPPGSPVVWDRYVVAGSWTGAWTGKDGQIAEWSGSVWVFSIPSTGWFVYSTAWAWYYRCVVTAWPVYTWSTCAVNNWFKEWTRFDVIDLKDWVTLRINSSVSINNFDAYSIYTTLANYITFKYSGSATTGKIWVNALNDAVTIFTTFSNVRDLEFFDGYLFWCTSNRVFYRSITSPTSGAATNFFFNDDEVTCIESTGDFLLVWAKQKTYAMVRSVQSASGDFTYSKRELTQIGLFSKKSILTYGGSVYVILTDKHWYGLNVSFTAQSAQVQLKDVWIKVQRYLDLMEVWDPIEWFWYNSNFGFVLQWAYDGLLRYNEPWSWFLVDSYWYQFTNMRLDWSNTNCTYAANMYIRWGWSDDDKDITQKIVIIWPEWVVWFPHRELLARLVFGYNNVLVKCRVQVEMDGGLYSNKVVFDPTRAGIIQWMNSLWDWTLGTRLIGTWILWVWGNDDANKIGIVWLRLWKTCHMAKWTITNVDNANFYFGRLDVLHQDANPILVPIKNVI